MNKTVSEQQEKVSVLKQIFSPTPKKIIALFIFFFLNFSFILLGDVCNASSLYNFFYFGSKLGFCDHLGSVPLVLEFIAILVFFAPISIMLPLLWVLPSIERVLDDNSKLIIIILLFFITYYALFSIISYAWKKVLGYMFKKKEGCSLLLIFLFLIVVNGALATTDSNLTNNALSTQINVTQTSTLKVLTKPVKEFLDSYDLASYETNMGIQMDFLNSTYPLSNNGLQYNLSENTISVPVFTPEDPGIRINVALLRLGMSVFLSEESAQYDRFVGVYKSDFLPYSGVAGGAGLNRFVIVDEQVNIASAHELGHTFNLCDEYVDGSNNFTAQDDNKTISEGGCPNHDVNEDGLLDADCSGSGCFLQNPYLVQRLGLRGSVGGALKNFMGSGSGGPHWIDNQSYTHFLDKLNNSSPVFNEEVYVIPITFNKSDRSGKFGTIYKINSGYLSSQQEFVTGNYTAEFRSASGNIIANFSLAPKFKIRLLNSSEIETNETTVLIVIDSENVTQFTVLLNGSVNETRNATPSTPNVTLISAISDQTFANPFNVTWNASDIDNDSIVYALLISDDNGTSWSTIDFDINASYYSLDNADFSYGTLYKIKVLASDGVNTGSVVSNGTFTIVPPPRVSVTDFSEFYSAQGNVFFAGVVVNDGGQDLSYLAWRLNVSNDTVLSSINASLLVDDVMTVLVEYNYSLGGLKNISFLSFDDNKSVNDSFNVSVFVGDLRVDSLSVVLQNGTMLILSFPVYNNGSTLLSGVNWTLRTGEGVVFASSLFNLSAFNSTLINVSVNYSDSGVYFANVTVWDGFSNYTATLNVSIPDFQLNFTKLYQSYERVVMSMHINNTLHTVMSNVSWRLETGEDTVSSTTNVSLFAGQMMILLVEKNYTTYGDFVASTNVSDGLHSVRASLSLSVRELNLTNFQKLSSNNTIGTFVFDVGNIYSQNRTATWSFDTNDTGIVWASSALTLTPNENVSVFFQHNFSATGNRSVLAKANTSLATYNTSLNTTIS